MACAAALMGAAPDDGRLPLAVSVHAGTWLGKPPMARLDLDVLLRNPFPRPRWAFVAGTLGVGHGGIGGVTVYELPGPRRGRLVRLDGQSGGWAVRLAPGGEVVLSGLAVESWLSPLPDRVSVVAALADGLAIGGTPLAALAGGDEVATESGVYDARIDPMRSRVLGGRPAKVDAPELPLELTDSTPATMEVVLDARGTGPGARPSVARAVDWPASWAPLLGQAVTVEGMALDAKEGALLAGPKGGGDVWIDGVDAWPSGYYKGGDMGARVRVTGRVIGRDDRPVFVDKEGEPKRAGVPVPEGTDLEKAARRYLLADATWTRLER